MSKRNVFLAALAAMSMCAPAWAVNKCTGPDGKVYFQDTPCAAGHSGGEIKDYATHPNFDATKRNAAALCESRLRTDPAWKDPGSVQITDVSRAGFTTIRMHDATLAVVRYTASVNAKNSYGAYTGARLASCYMDGAETRVLRVETAQQ